MLNTVKRYLRIEGSQDDALLAPLISAAQQYLRNAGVAEVEEPEPGGEGEGEGEGEELVTSGELALYQIAVCLYVAMMYGGGKTDGMDRAMTAIILQIKDYGGGDRA